MMTMLLVGLGLVVALALGISWMRRGNSGAPGYGRSATDHMNNPQHYGQSGGGGGSIGADGGGGGN